VSQAALVVVSTGERFPIEGSVTIGRSGCDIDLDDDQVSRRHATIRQTPGGVEIEDLGSRNGTRVNDAEIEPGQALRQGDIVEIGNVRLRFEGAAAGGPPAPPQFQAGASGKKTGPSAARRNSATLVAAGTIFGTAAALIAYFADRGL